MPNLARSDLYRTRFCLFSHLRSNSGSWLNNSDIIFRYFPLGNLVISLFINKFIYTFPSLSLLNRCLFVPPLHCIADISITFCCNSTQLTAFQDKMNLTSLRHCNAVTLQSLCSECNAATQLNAIMVEGALVIVLFLSYLWSVEFCPMKCVACPGGGPLECQGGYQARPKIHVIRVVF